MVSRRGASLWLGILLEPTIPPQTHDSESGFGEDASGHLARAQLAVDEDDGHFLDAEAAFVGGELHLNLEGVAFEADGVEVNGLEHLAAVADETGGGVVNVQAGDELHVLRGEVGHQHASHGPVDHVHARDVARADAHVVALVLAGCQQSWKVRRGVAEVGVHLEDVFVAVGQCPLEAGDVCRSQSQLAAAFYEEHAVGELIRHQPLDDVGSAIGRAVVDDQDIKGVLLSGGDGADDVLDVFLLVVGRDDDDAVCLHGGIF